MNYFEVGKEINDEYEQYLNDPEGRIDNLFKLLFPYLCEKVTPIMYIDGSYEYATTEDIVSETLTSIFQGGIRKYDKSKGSFSSWCIAVTKNRCIDYIRKKKREEIDYICDEDFFETAINPVHMPKYSISPEQQIIHYEYSLTLCKYIKDCISVITRLPEKPYKTVSVCHTVIAFRLHNSQTRDMSSPAWAYSRLSECTVKRGADIFEEDMRTAMPDYQFRWGEQFWDGMDETEDGMYISDMIFGEHFTKKDFDNWRISFSKKVKYKMAEVIADSDFKME